LPFTKEDENQPMLQKNPRTTTKLYTLPGPLFRVKDLKSQECNSGEFEIPSIEDVFD